MTRRTLFLAAAAAVLAGFLAWRLLAKPPRTDEERILALFDDAARAAQEKRVSDAVEGVSERFRGGGLDRQGVKQLVAFHVLRGEWVSVSVAGARVSGVDGTSVPGIRGGAQAAASVARTSSAVRTFMGADSPPSPGRGQSWLDARSCPARAPTP